MARIALSAYAVRVKEFRGETDDYEFIHDYGGNDLLPFFDNFVRTLNTRLEDAQKVARMRVATVATSGRSVAGVCDCGEYGYEAEGVNSETGAPSYHRALDDAELLPFYYLADLPQDRRQGILLLQRFGHYGMHGAFAGAIIPAFRAAYPDYRLTLNPISSGTAWRRYFTDGEINVVRFIRYLVPRTPEAVLNPDAQWEQPGYTEIAMHSGRLAHLPFDIGRFLPGGDTPVTQIIELQGFQYDTIKVEVELHGVRRTFDLGEPLERMVLDVTGRLQLGPDGHPTFASMDPIARAFVTDVRAAMGQGAGEQP